MRVGHPGRDRECRSAAPAGELQIQGVGRFPRRAAGRLPSEARRTRATTRAHRSHGAWAAVAWAAVEDAVYQTPRLAATTGRGLRGGTYKVKRGKATMKITYRRARFSRDVAVSGVASLDIATSRLTRADHRARER